MKTIGKHWRDPESYKARCDICGMAVYSGETTVGADGLVRCPKHEERDKVTLARHEGWAEAEAARREAQNARNVGRGQWVLIVKPNPQAIFGERLMGWWEESNVRWQGNSLFSYHSMLEPTLGEGLYLSSTTGALWTGTTAFTPHYKMSNVSVQYPSLFALVNLTAPLSQQLIISVNDFGLRVEVDGALTALYPGEAPMSTAAGVVTAGSFRSLGVISASTGMTFVVDGTAYPVAGPLDPIGFTTGRVTSGPLDGRVLDLVVVRSEPTLSELELLVEYFEGVVDAG